MPQAGFETAIPATKRPKNYPLDGAATGINAEKIWEFINEI
jgi:hypothetical protein